MPQNTAQSRRISAVLVCFGSKEQAVLIEGDTDGGNDWSGFKFKEHYVRDADGNEIKFMNMLPALEYMESIGWTIPDKEEQIYRNIAQTINGRSSFLLYKEVSEQEWLEWIEKGIYKK